MRTFGVRATSAPVYQHRHGFTSLWNSPLRLRVVREYIDADGNRRVSCSCPTPCRYGLICRHELFVTRGRFSVADISLEYHINYLLGHYDSALFGPSATVDRTPSTGLKIMPGYNLLQQSDVKQPDPDSSDEAPLASFGPVDMSEQSTAVLGSDPEAPQPSGEQPQYVALLNYQKQILGDFKKIGVSSVRVEVLDKVRELAEHVKVHLMIFFLKKHAISPNVLYLMILCADLLCI